VLPRIFVSFFIIALAACEKSSPTQRPGGLTPAPGSTPQFASAKREWGPAHFDVCGLIRKEEVEAIVQSPIEETKAVGGADGSLLISQCFYLSGPAHLAVSLSVTRADPKPSPNERIKKYWSEMFSAEERAENSEPEEKNRSAPTKVEGLGEEAYWAGAALSVLKNDSLIRIGIGGGGDEETRLGKAKAIAAKVLARL
jgi:hypothetical protein